MLDGPLRVQTLNRYARLLRGDVEQSLLLNRSVTEAILERLPVTTSLTLLALGLTVVIGPAGDLIAAVKRNT